MNKGFTLIELMVSVTIFIVVMVIALGSLLSISEAERKAETLKTVMNNLNFGLESMARSIRIGTYYHCGSTGIIDEPQDCDITGQDYFAFEPVTGNPGDPDDQVVYRLESGTICGEGSIGGFITVSKNGGTINTFSALTSREVNITNLTFYVVGSVPEFIDDNDNRQPKVTITMHGSIPSGASQTTEFSLQTSVTQRIYAQELQNSRTRIVAC